MLNEGKFESVITVIVTVAKEVIPRKFLKLSVIIYDAFVRFCANIVIGVETWYRELKLFRYVEMVVVSILAADERADTIH